MSILPSAYPLADRPLSVVGLRPLPADPSADASAGAAAAAALSDPPPAGAGVLGGAASDVPDVPRHTRRRRTPGADAVVPLAGPDAQAPPRGRRARSRRRTGEARPPDLAAAIAERARARGLDLDAYVAELLAADGEGLPAAASRLPSPDPAAPEPAAPAPAPQAATPEVIDPGSPRALAVRSRPASPVDPPPRPAAVLGPSAIVALVLAGLLAVVLVVLTYVAAAEYFPRYEVMTVARGPGQLGIYRVDRWTGDISYCGVRPAAAGVPAASACVSMDLDPPAAPADGGAAAAAAPAPAAPGAALP